MVMEKSISIQKTDLRKLNNRNTNKTKNRGLMRLSIDFNYTNRFSREKKKNIRSIYRESIFREKKLTCNMRPSSLAVLAEAVGGGECCRRRVNFVGA
ncbi:unnamed protein product [Lactuca virosa]|uniref:Uncharacterized protein n=1 Tax=Lactuca virosa TaxID=75947 RepID=A0AAU9LVM3_9ASTR|nr:unnamed protein product [Lactuca virosa]